MYTQAWRIIGVLLLVSAPALVAAQSLELVVSAPARGATIRGTEVMVNFDAQGITIIPPAVPASEAGKRPDVNRPGQGHVHLALDLLPVVMLKEAKPYTFTDVPPGEHQLTVELVNNDHSPFAPRQLRQISFRTAMLLPATSVVSDPLTQPSVLLVLVGLLVASGWWLHCRHADLAT